MNESAFGIDSGDQSKGAIVLRRSTRKSALAAIIFMLGVLPWRVGAAARQPDPVGVWLGTLFFPGVSHGLRLVVHVTADSAGKFKVALDSIDQGAAGFPGTGALEGNHFTYEIPSLHGRYSGTVSSDGNTITGEWKQYITLPLEPLVLERLATDSVPTVVAQPTPAPAMPPVALDNLKAVLDRELAPVLDHGVLSKDTGGGLVIGVLDHGRRRIFAYGTAKPDSIFEIGSVTKTFTGLILAQMVAQKKVTLDEPVRELFPAGFVTKPDGPEITLLDLATHHSGLPREPREINYPKYYGDDGFGVPQLREFLAQHIAKPANPQYLYSNIGFALLGYSLSQRAGLPYEQLLRRDITGPLHMNDTVADLSPAQQKRLIQGYDAYFDPAGPMNVGLFPGGGGIKSTAADMLTYLDASMHPEKYAAGAGPDSLSATLLTAVAIDHRPRAEAYVTENIALAWTINDFGTYEHNGETYGFGSYAGFNAGRDQALVVLYNRQTDDYYDRVAANVSALTEGRPAISLDVISEVERDALEPHTFSNRSIRGSYNCLLAAFPLAASVRDSFNIAATGDVHLVADGKGAITEGMMTYRLAPPNNLVCKLKLDSGRYSIKPDGTGTETETGRLVTDESPRRCFAFSSPARPHVEIEGQLKLTDTAGKLFHSASIAPFAMLNRVCESVSP